MIQFSIRLPEDMYSAIKEAADKEHRSINAQVLRMLEDVTTREIIRLQEREAVHE